MPPPEDCCCWGAGGGAARRRRRRGREGGRKERRRVSVQEQTTNQKGGRWRKAVEEKFFCLCSTRLQEREALHSQSVLLEAGGDLPLRAAAGAGRGGGGAARRGAETRGWKGRERRTKACQISDGERRESVVVGGRGTISFDEDRN